MKTVNAKIKIVTFLLILSAICCTLGSYFQGNYNEDSNEMLVIDLIWVAVILWMIFDLTKKRNINITLYGLILVTAGFAVFDYIELGPSVSLAFYTGEIVCFILSAIILKGVNVDYWQSKNG